MITADEIQGWLRTAFPDGKLHVKDMTGTGDHYEIEVLSELFRGKSMLEQHRLVHQALGNAFEGPLHAVKIKTRVP